MKKLSCIILVFSFAFAAYAQSGYVHDAMEEKYGEPGKDKLSEWMNGKLLNVKIAQEYSFPLSMQMHCSSYKKGAIKDEYDISYFLNPPEELFATKGMEGKKSKDEMLMIYDYKANAMIMLNQKNMTGMAFNINAFMSGDAIRKREEAKAEKGTGHDNTNCKKTGKSKLILGYSCDEYVCIDMERNTRSEIWTTNKVPIDISGSGMRGPMSGYFRSASGLGGMMMAADFYKDDQLEMKMEITNVNSNAGLAIKTDQYKFNSR